MRPPARLVPPVLLVLALACPSAYAQVASENAAAAESLFREGKALMKDGKYDEACPKLAASNSLDPGAGTLLNLGDCYEKAGKTASAWAGFLEAARLAQKAADKDREAAARERASALEGKLVRLRIEVPAASRVPGLVIERDGAAVAEGTWGSATPVDPGPHRVSATAPGYAPWSTELSAVEAGKTESLAIPALVAAAAPPPPAAAPPAAAPPPAPAPPAASPPVETDDGSGARTAGLVVGGLGLVGLIVGSAVGLGAKSKWESADCPGTVCKTAEDQTNAEDARSLADVATVAFAAGGALLATGAVIYLTAPSSDAPSDGTSAGYVRLAPSLAGGLVLDGAF